MCLRRELHLQGAHVLVVVGQDGPCRSWVKSGRARCGGTLRMDAGPHSASITAPPILSPRRCLHTAALGPEKLRALEGGRGGSCFRDISRVAGPPPGEEGRGTSCEAEAGPGPPRSGLALAQEPWFGACSWCSVIILVAGRGHVWELTASVLSQSRVFRPHSCPCGGNFGVSAVNDVSPGSPGHSPASSETEGTWSAAHSHLGRTPTPAAHRG